MTTKVDAIVLGAGNAGQSAAATLREGGRSVVLAEARDVGGTCPLRGCIPKKVLVAAAETLDTIARASRLGITAPPPRLDWAALIAKKRELIAGTIESGEQDLARRGITLVKGEARFVGPRAVEIGGARYEAEVLVVATGARPRTLDLEGAGDVVTSDDLLDLDALPGSLAFLGAGVIAFELTHVFARAGVKVTLLEVAPHGLGGHDPACVERLARATRALGVEIHTGVRPTKVTREGDSRVVTYEHDGETRALRVDLVANGAGRVPDYEGLRLDLAGIALHDGKPALDRQQRSKDNERVWFAGDVRPGPQLSPMATYEGRVVARAILGSKAPVSHEAMPSVVYTIPPLASVGMTEETARKAGLDVRVIENDMTTWKSARTYGEDVAFAKVIVEKGSGRIVGAHLLRRRADEAIHAFASAMKHGVSAGELAEGVFAFPTVTADAKYLVG